MQSVHVYGVCHSSSKSCASHCQSKTGQINSAFNWLYTCLSFFKKKKEEVAVSTAPGPCAPTTTRTIDVLETSHVTPPSSRPHIVSSKERRSFHCRSCMSHVAGPHWPGLRAKAQLLDVLTPGQCRHLIDPLPSTIAYKSVPVPLHENIRLRSL